MAKRDETPPDLSTIGGRLKWARLQYETPDGERLSARGAAKHFGWPENTYKSHENGIRQSDQIKKDTAVKYARAYGVDYVWVMTGRGAPYRKTGT